MDHSMNRRTFIKGAAAAGVVLAAGSYFTWNGRNIPEKVQRGDVTYDVLIIGSGGAGMRAALAAAENKDLKVAVLTKLVPTRSASTMAQEPPLRCASACPSPSSTPGAKSSTSSSAWPSRLH